MSRCSDHGPIPVHLVALAVAVAVALPSFLAAQQPPDRRAQLYRLAQDAEAVAQGVLDQLRDSLPDSLRTPLAPVELRVAVSPDPRPLGARMDGGTPVIELTAGLHRTIEFLSEASALTALDTAMSIEVQYLDYVASSIRRGDYWFDGPRKRYGYEMSEDGKVELVSSLKVGMTYAYLLAHELAHHLLGHTALDADALTREELRALELAADKEAARLLIPMAGTSPTAYALLGGAGYLFLELSMAQAIATGTMETEELRTHPVESRRIGVIAEVFIEQAEPRLGRGPETAWAVGQLRRSLELQQFYTKTLADVARIYEEPVEPDTSAQPGPHVALSELEPPTEVRLPVAAAPAILGVPLPAGAELRERAALEGAGAGDSIETYTISAAPSDIVAFYRWVMPAAGWTRSDVGTEGVEEPFRFLMFERGTTFALIGVSRTEGMFLISVSR